MSAGSDDLHPILSNIHETLGDILEWIQKVKGEVEAVKEALVEGFDAVQDAIHDSIQAQAELQLMEHVADVEAIEPQIAAEQERIESEQEDLDERLEQIAERYERRHEELDEQASERVRDLGSHIFEIDEGQFEMGIEAPFTEHVTTAWSTFQKHNESVKEERREEIEIAAGDTVQSIHSFVDQQQELLDQIDKHRTDVGVSPSKATPIQLPYYRVSLEVDGQTVQHIVIPSEVEDSDGATTVSLTPLPGLEDLISPTQLVNASRERYSPTEICIMGEPYRADAPPLLSYGDAVEDALGEDVEVYIEGGEN